MTDPETQCTSVAELMVDDLNVGYLRCTEPAGHDEPTPCLPWCRYRNEHPTPGQHEPGTPHRCELTWADGEELRINDADSAEAFAAIDLEPGARDDIEPNPADVLSIASIVPVPGLCNIEGCVFVAEHERAGSPLHSWARGQVARILGIDNLTV